MRLNEMSPGKGAKKAGKRFGRGHSAGQGKTCGRGQKGQHARSGGYHKVGSEAVAESRIQFPDGEILGRITLA